MIWVIGIFAFVFYRVFNAGMNSESLFYSPRIRYSGKPSEQVLDGDKVFLYVVATAIIGVTWPISIPAIGIYLLGKRYAK